MHDDGNPHSCLKRWCLSLAQGNWLLVFRASLDIFHKVTTLMQCSFLSCITITVINSIICTASPASFPQFAQHTQLRWVTSMIIFSCHRSIISAAWVTPYSLLLFALVLTDDFTSKWLDMCCLPLKQNKHNIGRFLFTLWKTQKHYLTLKGALSRGFCCILIKTMQKFDKEPFC